MLKVYQANRLEILLDALCGVLGEPLAGVFTPEIILVQSQGLGRWLSLHLASRLTISANTLFPFPASFVWNLARFAVAEDDKDFSFAPEELTWAIMAMFASLPDDPDFKPLQQYLAACHGDLGSFQLAGRVSRLYDKYAMYRPEWIMRWDEGELPPPGFPQAAEARWQAKLWRSLTATHGHGHRALLLNRLLNAIDQEFLARAGIPERLSIFAAPSFAPILFAVMERLARFIDVHLFLAAPCQVFWEDIIPRRQILRNEAKAGSAARDLHLFEGHPLLSTLGGFGRDFQKILLQYDFEETSSFVDPGRKTLLHAVQSDILNLTTPESTPDATPAGCANDISLQFHSVHSPLREIEVLHDKLLDLFKAIPGLEPRDVLVMAPDITSHAPLIEAVFAATGEKGGAHIPYAIADRSLVDTSVAVRAFLELLRMAGERLQASHVMSLLEVPVFGERFDITAEDCETIAVWIREAPAYFGLDSQHRAAMGLPAEAHGTWRACLDRLFLGFAMPGEEAGRFLGDILPYDHIEGEFAELLARFAAFLEMIETAATLVRENRAIAAWHEVLIRLLDNLFSESPSYEEDAQAIRAALKEIMASAVAARFDAAISIEIIVAVLEEKLTGRSSQGGFLSGKVTFCQMLPMRSIPFRVICMLGLQEGAFPRLDMEPDFDLMKGDYRPGDRLRRDDDLYLFLEAMLSARDVLYLSFVGQDRRDGSRLPPAIVVSELLAAAAGRLGMTSEEAVETLVVHHPLQPFSRRYFSGDPRLVTFSAGNYAIASHLAAKSIDHGGLFSGVTTVTAAEAISEVTVDELITFFLNPVRHLLRKRFQLNFDDVAEDYADRERFSLDGLSRYGLIERLTRDALAGADIVDKSKVLATLGLLPQGMPGEYAFRECVAEAQGFSAKIKEKTGAAPPSPDAIDLTITGIRITGMLGSLYPAGRILFRPGEKKKRSLPDIIRHWLAHLLYNAIEPLPGAGTSFFLYRDGALLYEPLKQAREELGVLLGLYRLGRAAPLLLFPKSSLAYASALWQAGKKKSGGQNPEDEALERAITMWNDGDFLAAPEKDNPYFHAAFGDRDPISGKLPSPTPTFSQTAAMVLERAFTESVEE